MKVFTRQHLKLQHLSLSSKTTYTIFLAFAALGIVGGIVLGGLKTQWTYAGTIAYYRGDEAAGLYARTPMELLETAHFHLFSQPMLFFIVGHIFLLSALARPFKIAVVCASFAAIAADTASPWLIVYGAPGFAALKLLAGQVLGVCFLIELAVSLYEMWWR